MDSMINDLKFLGPAHPKYYTHSHRSRLSGWARAKRIRPALVAQGAAATQSAWDALHVTEKNGIKPSKNCDLL